VGHRVIWIGLVGVAAAAAVGAAALVVTRDGSAADAGAAPHLVMSELDHRYEGDAGYFVGGGVATFDCDADGFPDLFLAGGEAPSALYRNTSPVGGELRFEPVPSAATGLTHVTGAYPLDVDSDGVADLMVLRHGGGGNVLLRGLGDCAFDESNAGFGLDGGNAWTVAFSATWEGDNVLPTLAFGHFLRPDTHECDGNELMRPAGGRYAARQPLDPGYCSLSMLFSDWDRSGRRDLRVANDRNYYLDGSEQLWRMDPGGPPRPYTEADGWRKLQVWGMGIASTDLDGDGYPEVYVTSQGDNKLQQLDTPGGDPSYHDIALDRGVTATQPFTGGDVLPSTAWHPQFADVNNDGRADLLVTKGNVEGQPDYAVKDPTNLFLQQADGTFTEGAEAAGMVRFERTRGASVADLNLDGLLDGVLVHRQANVTVWRNVGSGAADAPGPMGHWLQLRLSQPAPNVDAVGAWIEVRTGDRVQSIELTVGGGHASGQLGWTHVGLGPATGAEVRVHWPDGETGEWAAVEADRFLLVERGAPSPVEWQPS